MKASTPLVSIIMAAKDTGPYIAECLDSIIAQTYTHWELIAINDHSDDNTPQILEEYAAKDARIKVVHSKRRKLIPALKEGYPHMTGTLINRMDSDDRMPDYKLELMVSAWQEKGKGTVVVGGTEHFRDDVELGDGFRRYDAWLNEIARKEKHLEQIYRECVVPSHCWMMHKEDLDAIGAFEPEVYPEDYDLTFRMYKHGLQFHALDRILHHWRDRSDRISRTWEVYKDNRYFDMKLKYFLEIDRDENRPLVIWGAGRNGKDFAKLLKAKDIPFHWVCETEGKIGHNIYDVIMQSVDHITTLNHPQILVMVAAPDARAHITSKLNDMGKTVREDFWFFC